MSFSLVNSSSSYISFTTIGDIDIDTLYANRLDTSNDIIRIVGEMLPTTLTFTYTATISINGVANSVNVDKYVTFLSIPIHYNSTNNNYYVGSASSYTFTSDDTVILTIEVSVSTSSSTYNIITTDLNNASLFRSTTYNNNNTTSGRFTRLVIPDENYEFTLNYDDIEVSINNNVQSLSSSNMIKMRNVIIANNDENYITNCYHTFFSFSSFSHIDSIKITATASKIANSYTVSLTKNLSNCTISPTDDTITYTENISNIIIISPINTSYNFNSIPTITINDVTTEFTLNSDGNYQIDINDLSITSDVTATITATCTIIEDLIDIDVENMVNVSFTNNSDTQFNKTVYAITNIYIKANDGYIINETPYLLFNLTDTTAKENFIYDSENDYYYLNYTNYYTDISSVAIYANGEVITELLTDLQLIKAYKTTTNILTSLKSVRFFNVDTNVYEDLAEYILDFIQYPFSIDSENSSNIILGFYDTSINCPYINTQIFTLSLGKITINGIYKNQNDVNNCEITANLKYYGLVTIDSKYINTEIEIKYITDVIANKTSIQIFSNDVLIQTVQCQIGFSIPYILKTDKPSIYNTNFNSIKTLENIDSQIIVTQNKNSSNRFSAKMYSSLSNLSNFNKIDNLELNVSNQMTLNEINEIKNKLLNGVIF